MVQTGLRIYCADRAKVIQECKNPIAKGDFDGFLHVTVQLSELLQRVRYASTVQLETLFQA